MFTEGELQVFYVRNVRGGTILFSGHTNNAYF